MKNAKWILLIFVMILLVGCGNKNTNSNNSNNNGNSSNEKNENVVYKKYGLNTIVLTIDGVDYELDDMNREIAWNLLCESDKWTQNVYANSNSTNEEVKKLFENGEETDRLGIADINVMPNSDDNAIKKLSLTMGFHVTDDFSANRYSLSNIHPEKILTEASINGAYVGMTEDDVVEHFGKDYKNKEEDYSRTTYYYDIHTKSGKEGTLWVTVDGGYVIGISVQLNK